ncbi:alkylphosphonate ABC transporter substrate-binidng protein [Metamycoplasma phocicerebrale]|uniref:Alkylphosphonate ABC transporter substrate-binidng protein n=1 Tax=Metamycoplasma phocicerebrale TaxID=142649 RepID=A0A3T0TTW5_9BACT|nr:alkylphosphonate ABC transporter substrate-binidng protein [Metamycoplasma phocicerebrale]AZZ65463.2 alkylphosphonate ABC transporter substrate-binidng protein [Metamycoplasma phocicerebrale]
MKKISIFLSSLCAFGLPLAAISCNNKKGLFFGLNSPWYGKKNEDFFIKVFEQYKEKTNNKNLEYKTTFVAENNDTVSLLKKGTVNIATITTPLLIKQKSENIIPIIQTLTRAFKFDLNASDLYSNGLENDKLRKIAKNVQELFDKKPYKDWSDEEYKWNGHIYETFYANKDTLVDYYRGIIMIQGNEEQLKQIKKAWEEKDWNTFRNFGIVLGKATSGSKYILPEALFKKHFNLENNKFTSFAIDSLKNSKKYLIEKAKNIGKGSLKNYHIVFDEMGSFAYTNNKNGNYYTLEDPNSKIEFLTATEPLKYNVIAVNKDTFSDEQIKILKEIIFSLWKEGKDNYGPRVGFNGYKIINDIKTEVIDPYNNLFK